MTMEARYFKIGVFVIASLVLAAVFIITFGGRDIGPVIVMETYMTESVTGLARGGPVRFKGVQIGEVRDLIKELLRHAPHRTAKTFFIVDECQRR